MRVNGKIFGFGLLVAFLLSGTALAGMGDVSAHGMISQSFIQSSGNNFLVPNSEDGNFAVTEYLLNASTNVSSKLRVGLQLYGKDVGSNGNNKVVVDWAFGDYRWKDQLGFRAGKIKLPFGLYNAGRDLDMIRNPMYLPQSVYPEAYRDVANTVTGFSVYGTLALGDNASLEYDLYKGTSNLDDTTLLDDQFNIGAPLLGYSADVRYSHGGRVIINTPVEGLRVGASLASAKLESQAQILYPVDTGGPVPSMVPADIALEYEVESWMVFSGEYTRGDLVLAAEYMLRDDKYTQELVGLAPAMDGEDKWEGYYGQAVYRFSPLFELGAFYSVYYPDRDDKDGERYAASEQEFLAWNKDLGITARFDVTDGWVLKLEGHFVDGAASSNVSPGEDGYEDSWNWFGARATYYF